MMVNNFEVNVVSPIKFGAIGDSITDDTRAFQEAINFAQDTGATLDGLGKTYLISDALGKIPSSAGSTRIDYGLYINKSITIKNTKLKLKDNCKDFTTVLNIYSPKDSFVNIENVTINGNKENQMHTSAREDGGMHGIRIYGNTLLAETGYIHINKCSINNCQSDGLLFRAISPQKAVIENCSFIMNTRNGMTDNALDNVNIKNCIFSGTKGTYPESGYHCEPDDYQIISCRVIEGCITKNNVTGFRFDIRPGNCDGITIKDCYSLDNEGISFITESSETNPRFFRNITIDNCNMNQIIFSHNTAESGAGIGGYNNIRISNCTLSNIIGITFKSLDAGIGKQISVDNCYGTIMFVGRFQGVNIKNLTSKLTENNQRGVNGLNITSMKDLVIDSCNFENINSISVSIDLRNGNYENVKIKNCSFKTDGYSIFVKGDKIFIDGNTFYARGSWNYFTRGENTTNVIYSNNIHVNKQVDGTIPSGAYVDNLPLEAIKTNNIIV